MKIIPCLPVWEPLVWASQGRVYKWTLSMSDKPLVSKDTSSSTLTVFGISSVNQISYTHVAHTKELFSQQHFSSHTSKQASHAFFFSFTIPVMSAIIPNDWCNDTQRLPSNETLHLHYSYHYPPMCEWYGYNNNGADNTANTFYRHVSLKAPHWHLVYIIPAIKQAMHNFLSPWAIFLTALCETLGSLLVHCSLNRLKCKWKVCCIIVQFSVPWEVALSLLTVSL